MYKKILVPLDGSTLAEVAIPYAIRLATQLESELILFRVASAENPLPAGTNHQGEYGQSPESYLGGIHQLIIDSTNGSHAHSDLVKTTVVHSALLRERDIAEKIVREKADLVVMATHGRSGMLRLILGSLASHLLEYTDQPVLLIRPSEGAMLPLYSALQAENPLDSGRTTGCHILVTLDGTPGAESALDAATDLALILKAKVHLLRIVSPQSPVVYSGSAFGPVYIYDAENDAKIVLQEAHDYLHTIQTQLTAKGLLVNAMVRMGTPATEITAYAQEVGASAVVMATHGRGKIGQTVLGSVAETVLRNIALPVLMVHVGHSEKHSQAKKKELVENSFVKELGSQSAIIPQGEIYPSL